MPWLKISLSLQMLIAAFLGLFCGLFFGESCSVLAPWANAYIMILKITAIPYLFLAVIQGIGQMTGNQGVEILKKGIFLIAIMWAINILMVYLVILAFPSVKGFGHSSFIQNESSGFDIAQFLIPDNIFAALANNIVPAVVVFSILAGIALIQVKEKEATMSFFETLLKVLTLMTKWISTITPVGTFLILAYQSGTINISTIQQIGSYIFLFIIGTSLLVFWMIPRLVSSMTHYSAWKWIKDLSPILILSFTTNLVIVALPYIIALVKREIEALCPNDEKAQTQVQGTVSVVYNLPLGSLFLAIFIFFVAHLHHVILGINNQLHLILTLFLTSLGAVGLGSWINNITFILDILGLPFDSIDLFLASAPFTAGFQSMVSAAEITALALLVTFSCRKLLTWKWRKATPQIATAFAPILLIFFGLKFFSPFPPLKTDGSPLTQLKIESSIKTKVYSFNESPPEGRLSLGEPFERIQKTKILRIGYNPLVLPFCFWNQKHQLVGYDVAFAYELAKDLKCQLEFVPLHYEQIGNELANGLYDIGMSAINLDEGRLTKMLFSKPYQEGRIVLVVREKMKKKFESLQKIKQNKNLVFAVLKGSVYVDYAQQYFPGHQTIILENYEQFPSSKADALLWGEPQAIAWSLLHHSFDLIFPKPELGISVLGYVVSNDGNRFLNYLNDWLLLKEAEGFKEMQYSKWILGKTPTEDQPKRWSILDNIILRKREPNLIK